MTPGITRPPSQLRLVGLAALVAVAAACSGGSGQEGVVSSLSYPASPTLERFGVTERCGRGDSSCEEQATAVIVELLGNLGEAYDGEGLGTTELSEALPNRLAVRADSSASLHFLANTLQGSASTAMFDLTGLIDGTPTYVVLSAPGGVARFEVPRDQAESLLDALFTQLRRQSNLQAPYP